MSFAPPPSQVPKFNLKFLRIIKLIQALDSGPFKIKSYTAANLNHPCHFDTMRYEEKRKRKGTQRVIL